MFSLDHILWLLLCTALVAIGIAASVKAKLSAKKASVLFFAVCCVSELVKDFCNMIPSDFGGFVLDPFDIPLHLCSVVVFAMLYIVTAKNDEKHEYIQNAVAVIGLAAPILALLIPTEGTDFCKPIPYQYFLYHAALFWYALHLVCTGQVTFGKKAYIRNLKYFGVAIVASLYLNSALSVYGVNVCFLREPPLPGLPILNLDHGWPLYFLTIVLIGFLPVTLVHLPGILRERKERK